MTRRVLCLLPDLNGGGAERVMIYVLSGLDRERFRPTLGLGRLRGPYVPLIPRDVDVVEFGAGSGRQSIGAIARQLRSGTFDLCFSMVSMNLAAVVARAIAMRDMPLVLSARNHYSRSLPVEARNSRLKMAAIRLLYPRAELITCVSQGVADDLVDHFGVRPDQTRVIHNPIDLARVRAQGDAPLHDDWLNAESAIPTLVAVGKLQPAKGYPDLLKAFRLVRDTMPVRLVILGEGPDRAMITKLIVMYGLERDIRLVGFDQNPYRYVRRATLFVHAALWEGFPNVLVEAMALGTPVVTTDCPSGPAEIITSPAEGVLVPIGDSQQLATQVIGLLSDPDRRRAVSAAALQRVRAFDSRVAVLRYAAVFDEVMRRGAG